MTQQYVPPWIFYVADGVQVSFPYPFEIGLAGDLEVYLQGVLTTAYTATGVGLETGGNVVLFNAPPAGQIIFIRRATPQTQLTDYIPNDPFDAQAHEAALDKLTRMIQDVYERISRSPAFAVTAANAMRNLLIPDAVPGKLLGWSADGTALTLYDSTIQQVTINPSSGEAHGISTITLASTGGVDHLTAAAFIPAGVKVKGVGYRVTTAFSTENSLASVDLGGMGITSGWGKALGITLNSINNEGQMRGDEPRTTVAQDVVLLPNPAGALFGATGAVRLTCFWRTLVPA